MAMAKKLKKNLKKLKKILRNKNQGIYILLINLYFIDD